MPFELHDFQDLVRSLREHPDWREELRALLLTQEVLTLPAVVRELTVTVAQLAEGQQRLTDRLEQLTARVDQLTDRLEQLTARVDQLTVTVTQLTEGQQRLTDRLEQLTEGQRRLEVHMGEVRGWTLEQRYRTHAPAYFGRLLRQVQPVDVGRLAEVLRERLEERDLAEVLLADLILSGRLPTPPGPPELWVVLEVSATVDRGDVERAQRRAALLRQAHYPAVAVAGGGEATAGARQVAGDVGVALLLDGHIEGWQAALHPVLEEEAGSR
jgi:TolA-binding protein